MRVLLTDQPSAHAATISVHVEKLSRGDWYQLLLATDVDNRNGTAPVTITAHLSSKGVSYKMTRIVGTAGSADLAVTTRFHHRQHLIDEIIAICNRRDSRGSSTKPRPFNPAFPVLEALSKKWNARLPYLGHLGPVCLYGESDCDEHQDQQQE